MGVIVCFKILGKTWAISRENGHTGKCFYESGHTGCGFYCFFIQTIRKNVLLITLVEILKGFSPIFISMGTL